MCTKISRKGKNPGPVDAWLDNLGYYRKNIAYDETCLFRAVSEQLYSCQIFHERVRKECIDYARENYPEFQHLVNNRMEWNAHLLKLKTHMAICGNIEIHIISKKYKRNVLLFDSVHRHVKDVVKDDYPETLLLCLMSEDHYDVVYKKEYIATAGFCQSIAYNILYEKVFEIPQVPNIVQAMLYDKPPLLTTNTDFFSEENIQLREKCIKMEESEAESVVASKKALQAPTKPDHMSDYEFMLQTNLAPFPFKVAKALDPTIYRNIEYDTWTEIRKEMRLGDWYYGDNNLILGTSCVFQDNGQSLQCYIQEILKGANECVVYVTSKAEKRRVKYSDLSPECDAKPWPLPYRFSKNLIISPQPDAADKDRKNAKKRKEKKRSVSKSSIDSSKGTGRGLTLDINDNVTAYEGCPLQMQQVTDTYDCEKPCQMETTDCYSAVEPSIMQWPGQWESEITPTPEPVVWTPAPPTPQPMYSYTPKPMIPGTPEVCYAEPYYFYESTYRYGIWNNTEYLTPSDHQNSPPTPSTDISMTPDCYNYVYYPESTYNSPNPMHSSKMCQIPMSPCSPQVEMYHPPVYAPQPNTPVIYASPDVPEYVMQPTPVMYTPPPVEYLPTPYCVVPSTPPTTWYPPGINSHGFIFPAPVATQNITSRM